MNRAPLAVIFAAALVVACGCARALKEPPPLAELGPPQIRPEGPQDAESLLRRGEFLYARRVLPEAREAAAAFLAAARAEPTRIEGLLGAVRAQAWLVDHESDAAAREAAAVSAVQSAQWCMRIAPESAACEYWLGAALGLQAREKRSTGLDALPLIEQAFRRAADKEPALEEGGPNRALALLYARAPGWPTGPGDPDRALLEARRAIEIAPGYPPNHLALGESLNILGDSQGARQAYSRALELAEARAAAGDPDAPEWIREAREGLAGNPSTP